MKKIKPFTIIELVVALGLMSIAITFLFTTMKQFIFTHMKIKTHLPFLIESEKNYQLLHTIVEKIWMDLNHPYEIKPHSLSFYYLPTMIDYDKKSSIFLAALSFEEGVLKLECFEETDKRKKLIHKIILMEDLLSCAMRQNDSPRAFYIDFETKNRSFKWTFLLEKGFFIKDKK
jgi:hypothetical protein